MKSLFSKSLLFILGLSAVSCVENAKPNYQYMPNMHETVSYEPYGAYDIFENEQEAKLPAEGSIPRGWMPYDYEDSNEGYQAAKEELTNPLPYTEENLAAGRELYTIYCAVCHGDNGDGQGILVQREKFLGVPSYDARDITEGSTYHVQYYGLNAMGSYASQTSIAERWLITNYVMDLRNALLGGPEREFEQVSDQGQQQGQQQGQEETLTPPVNANEEMIPKEPADDGGDQNQNEE